MRKSEVKKIGDFLLMSHDLPEFEFSICKQKDFFVKSGDTSGSLAGQMSVSFIGNKVEKRIRLENDFAKFSGAYYVYQNILHEIAHALVYKRWGRFLYELPLIGCHGILWLLTAWRIGYEFPRFVWVVKKKK